jgi:hypothetical protein
MSKTKTTDSELKVERVPRIIADRLKTARSLKPGVAMMNACVAGDPEAIEIRDSWQFSFPVRVVSREEFAGMEERGRVTFNA